jgi:hypothetical protein
VHKHLTRDAVCGCSTAAQCLDELCLPYLCVCLAEQSRKCAGARRSSRRGPSGRRGRRRTRLGRLQTALPERERRACRLPRQLLPRPPPVRLSLQCARCGMPI